MRIRVRPVLVGPLRPLFAGITAFEIGNCATTLLILRASEQLEPGHGQDRATTITLGLYIAYNLAATLTSVSGHHADRRGATRVLLVGAATFALAYLAFTRDTTNWVLLLPSFVLAEIGIGCVETAEHAAVATHAPNTFEAPHSGSSPASKSVGNLAASAIAGILWTALGPTWAFTYLAAWLVLAVAILATTARTTNAPGR